MVTWKDCLLQLLFLLFCEMLHFCHNIPNFLKAKWFYMVSYCIRVEISHQNLYILGIWLMKGPVAFLQLLLLDLLAFGVLVYYFCSFDYLSLNIEINSMRWMRIVSLSVWIVVVSVARVITGSNFVILVRWSFVKVIPWSVFRLISVSTVWVILISIGMMNFLINL